MCRILDLRHKLRGIEDRRCDLQSSYYTQVTSNADPTKPIMRAGTKSHMVLHSPERVPFATTGSSINSEAAEKE